MLEKFGEQILTGAIEVVDLTFALDPDFPVLILPPEFGQCQPFRVEEVSHYDERGPAWYWRNFTCSEHTGTHFDAPIHWVTGRDLPHNSVDAIAPDNFIRPVFVMDFSQQCAGDDDFILTDKHIIEWEKQYGKITAGSWVLFRTDWSKHEPEKYVNLAEDGMHTPGPDASAIHYLVETCDIVGFGVETIGTDAGQGAHFDPPYPAHSILHGNNRFGLQCLCNLDQLPPSGAMLICAPLKIKHGSGSPLRVLALKGKHDE